ncbi:ATP-grasp domain-containing protein [Streptantibioticus ferralitis]|uniref:ATP-grasp domain-containing protein n=1 Tax=Streptantibioticus ferralitis TaxID=236510 RepID=A0ABT5YVT3_9ACTN|nr:ATP-grasp domain-containing protein [Streptantibioticus ferralitis]MDF2255716.1 ATP-grasp domain-containing protein [Streptantibioticus ferralitis]
MHIVMLEVALSRGFDYLDDLVDAGVEVSLVVKSLAGYADAPGFARHRRAARVIEVPETEGARDLAEQIRGRLGPNPPDGVFCVTERCIPAAAHLARGLGVPGEPVETVALLRDKAAVRDRLTRAGLGTLCWRRVERVADGLDAAAGIGYPVVVKPLSGYASIGVTVAWAPEEAEPALAAALQAPGGARALVEEYAVGRHVSAELLVQRGRPILLGFAERLPTRPGTTAELGGHFPAAFEGRGAARRFALDVVSALGVRDSPLHIEMLITPTGPELIEVNGRIAGHVVTRQMELALGRSLTLDLAALAAGRPVVEAAEPVAAVALRQLWSERGGPVRAVRLPDELPSGVADCQVTVRPGDVVRPMRHNYDRIGHVLAEAPTVAEAAGLAERTARQIRITLDEAVDPTRTPTVGTGRHVLLLLAPDGVEPERVLAAVGATTGRVSVLWCGGAAVAGEVRARWAERYAGSWYDTPDADSAHRALAELHAVAPVAAVVGFAPSTAALAEALTAAVHGTPAPRSPRPHAATPGEGRTVVSLVSDDAVHHLGVIEDLGADSRGHRTVRYPCPLPPADRAALLDRATSAVREAGVQLGLVRCRFPDDGGPATVLPGLDEESRALLDALHPRDVVATATAAALGVPVRWAPPRPGTALLRLLAGPEGAFRVVQATSEEELYDDPRVASVHAALPSGTVHQASAAGRPVRLRYVVTGEDEADCRTATARIEARLTFRHLPLDRRHIVLIDRTGGAAWTQDNGDPVLDPERFRVSVLSGHPQAGTAAATVDHLQRLDVWDTDAIDRTVRTLHATHPVHRIACGSERLLESTAALRGVLGIPGDTVGYARAFRDKAEMKRIARTAGIRHAEGRVVYEPADAWELLDRHGAIVVKPRDASGSQGVAICRDRAALRHWLRTGFAPGRQLAEALVHGPMCHIDAVVHGGVVAWDVSRYARDTLAYTRGLPLSGQTCDDPRIRGQAQELLEQVVAAWRVRAGVLHLEAFDEGSRLTFCEVAARPGGAGVIRAFRATRGIDLRHAKVLIDAGEDPRQLAVEPVAEHAGWTVHYSGGGWLEEYDDSAVADRALHRTINARVGAYAPASDFSGTGISTHVFADDSAAEVGRLVTAAERDIRIRLR